MTWVSIAVVLVLILAEAFFVAAEIALVSLREGQVRGLLERNPRRGERIAALVHEPNRFLAAVQIGVTTTAILVSAFGEATLGHPVARTLRHTGLSKSAATIIGFVLVVLVITYVTIVVGELVPKRLALQRAEGAALALGPPLDRFSRLSRPVIWFLSASTDLLVRLAGGDPGANREAITEEELRDLVTAHESLSRDERRLIDEVFEAGNRAVREVMVPRTEVEFLDAAMTIADAVEVTGGLSHSRYPVCRGSHDDIVGFVHIRDLVDADRNRHVRDVVREVALLPATKKVLPAMSDLRRAGAHIAVVVDEYGGTAGIVTLEDIIEELVGEIRDEYDVEADESRRLAGGDMEVDGLLTIEDFAERTGLALPDGPYETVAGYLMWVLGHVPRLGEAIEVPGGRLTVTEMDGRRAARLQVSALPMADDVSAPEAATGP